MAAELGHFALVLALMMAVFGSIYPHVAIQRGDREAMARTSLMAVVMFLLVALSFACLTHSFLISDFSVRLVAISSHSAKPLVYKIAGVWGNHEGSLLLWVLILTLFNALLAIFGRNLPAPFKARVISVQNMLALGFLLFILLTSNPFERLDPAAVEGNGLNPLLQDIGLAMHPPMLYLGYVGISLVFSFAVAALIDGEVTPQWARYVRPWTLVAWIFLTGGIALGSWWAYYELGWGGWWFWDPVENASFMPWLAASALLHSAIVVEKRDSLKSWTVLLALVAFSFSLLGTFLVRSGVITSVHAFASDPERGVFILGFLSLVIGGSLTLYTWRAPRLKQGGLFAIISRESALVLNNIFLSTFAAVVLIGTLYPLMLEMTSGQQITVGPPFFNFATKLIMTPLIVALCFGPLLAWKRGKISRTASLLLPAALVAVVMVVLGLWASVGDGLLAAFGLALAGGLFASVLLELASRTKGSLSARLKRLANLPRAQWGMSFAHSGLALIVLGITVSEVWSVETIAAMRTGDTAEVGDYRFTLEEVAPDVGPNYTLLRGRFSVYEGDRLITTLSPEDRTYGDPVMNTTEADIEPLWHGDLYAVIGDATGDGRWSVRLYYKPAISGLWLGALFMVFGGLLSLSDRRLRLGATERRAAPGGAQTSPQPEAAE